MSDATKAAVEVALAAHLADEMNNAILTGWWVTTCGVDLDNPNRTSYFYDGPSTQPFHVSMGLDAMSSRLIATSYNSDD